MPTSIAEPFGYRAKPNHPLSTIPNRAAARAGVQTAITFALNELMRLLPDLILCVSSAKTCSESRLMLARVRRSGSFELLAAGAWASALGYLPAELSGKSLRQLMTLEHRAAAAALAALLDEEDVHPVEVTLRCKDERRKRFRFYRRFDAYDQSVFLVADEVSGEPELERLAANG
jgi:PAS domain-containing protein